MVMMVIEDGDADDGYDGDGDNNSSDGDGPFPPFFDSGFIFLILIWCCIALISGITTSD